MGNTLGYSCTITTVFLQHKPIGLFIQKEVAMWGVMKFIPMSMRIRM